MGLKIRMGEEKIIMSRLIVIEGIDGSGKTTLAEKLCEKLDNAIFLNKKSVDASTEFQKEFMVSVRHTLWENRKDAPINEIDEESWLYLHLLWYHMLQENVIKPYKEKYDYIVMDGWYFKFLARHIVNDKMEVEYAHSLMSRLVQGDIVMLLNIPPELCYERKNDIRLSECGIHKQSNIEDQRDSFCSYQQEVYDAYLSLGKCYNFVNIDATNSIEKIVQQMVEVVENYDSE